MTALLEIEEAARRLPQAEQERLLDFLAAQLRSSRNSAGRPQLLKESDGSVLLQAADGAAVMTPELVREILSDFP